mgnify:CR=1 FL=1
MDKLSYALGMSMASNMKQSGLDCINVDDFASAIKFEVLGSDMPFSHFETACLLTPRLSATNSCVILQFVLQVFNSSPKVFLVSIFSFLTSADFKYFLSAFTSRPIIYINIQ